MPLWTWSSSANCLSPRCLPQRRIWRPGHNRALNWGRTGRSSHMYHDQIPMVPAQLMQAPAPITIPKLCDLLQRCVSEAEPNGWDPYGHDQRFRNRCWASTKDCLVAVHQNSPNWSMLMMAGQFQSVEPKAETGLRGSSPVVAMSEGDRGHQTKYLSGADSDLRFRGGVNLVGGTMTKPAMHNT